GQRFQMLSVLIRHYGVTERGATQSSKEVILRLLEKARQHPGRFPRLRRRVHRALIVAGKVARLHFANRIKAFLNGQERVARQVTFERDFVDQFTVEAAEYRRQATKRPNECKLKNRVVSSAAELRFSGQRQGILRFA